jgi:hypothetical protein
VRSYAKTEQTKASASSRDGNFFFLQSFTATKEVTEFQGCQIFWQNLPKLLLLL